MPIARRALFASLVAAFALAANEAQAVTSSKKKIVKTVKASHKSATKVTSRTPAHKPPAQT